MSKELNQKPWQWVKLAHGATGVQMSCRHLVITCLLVSSVGVTARQTTTTLATKGEISVTTADVRANNPLMTDVDYQSLLQNPSAFRKNVEDVANARVAAIKLDRMAKSYDTPNEAAAFQVARERSVMSTALAMDYWRARLP